MRVPAVALQTFQSLSKEPDAVELVQSVLKKLSKLHDPLKRAQYIHRLVDESVVEVFDDPLVKDLSPCTKGCTGCCHTQVSVTEEEGELLAQRIQNGLLVDEERLRMQMSAEYDASAYYALDYDIRRCVFLDDEGGCRVYEDRPSVCRTNAVIGSAEQCDTRNTIQPTRLVKTPIADLFIYASFLHAKYSGTLAMMVGKALGR